MAPIPRHRVLLTRMSHFIQMLDGGPPGETSIGPKRRGMDLPQVRHSGDIVSALLLSCAPERITITIQTGGPPTLSGEWLLIALVAVQVR